MASPNAPILKEILNRLDSIDTRLTNVETRLTNVETRLTNVEIRLTKLETRFTKLETRFTTFEKKVNGYIKNESDIQELNTTQHIKVELESNFPVSLFEIIPFQYFFIPTSRDHITDIDGCIIRRTAPVKTTNAAGRNYNLPSGTAYIIEAKHSLTKQQIDKKLIQFCLILQTINDIHASRIIVRDPPTSSFDIMAAMLEVYNFPSDILFIFASDDINESLTRFIQDINKGDMTEEVYNQHLFNSIKESSLISTIILDPTVRKIIKHMIHQSRTLNELIGIFTQKTVDTSSSKKEQSFELQKDTLKPYQTDFFSMIVPYSTVESCYKLLKGKLGIFRMNELTHP